MRLRNPVRPQAPVAPAAAVAVLALSCAPVVEDTAAPPAPPALAETDDPCSEMTATPYIVTTAPGDWTPFANCHERPLLPVPSGVVMAADTHGADQEAYADCAIRLRIVDVSDDPPVLELETTSFTWMDTIRRYDDEKDRDAYDMVSWELSLDPGPYEAWRVSPADEWHGPSSFDVADPSPQDLSLLVGVSFLQPHSVSECTMPVQGAFPAIYGWGYDEDLHWPTDGPRLAMQVLSADAGTLTTRFGLSRKGGLQQELCGETTDVVFSVSDNPTFAADLTETRSLFLGLEIRDVALRFSLAPDGAGVVGFHATGTMRSEPLYQVADAAHPEWRRGGLEPAEVFPCPWDGTTECTSFAWYNLELVPSELQLEERTAEAIVNDPACADFPRF